MIRSTCCTLPLKSLLRQEIENKYNTSLQNLTTPKKYDIILKHSSSFIDAILILDNNKIVFFGGSKQDFIDLFIYRCLQMSYSSYVITKKPSNFEICIDIQKSICVSQEIDFSQKREFKYSFENPLKIYEVDKENKNKLFAVLQKNTLFNVVFMKSLFYDSLNDILIRPFKRFIKELINYEELLNIDFKIEQNSVNISDQYCTYLLEFLHLLDNQPIKLFYSYPNTYRYMCYVEKVYQANKDNSDYSFPVEVKKYNEETKTLIRNSYGFYLREAKKIHKKEIKTQEEQKPSITDKEYKRCFVAYNKEKNENRQKYQMVVIKNINNSFSRILHWNTPKYDNISGYRNYINSVLKPMKKNNMLKQIVIKDKWGIELLNPNYSKPLVPIIYTKNMPIYIHKEYYKRQFNMLDKIYCGKNLLSKCYYYLGTKEGEEIFVKIYTRIIKAYNKEHDESVLHDFGFIYKEIFDSATIFTKSVLKQILLTASMKELIQIKSYSYNILQNIFLLEQTKKAKKQSTIKTRMEKEYLNVRKIIFQNSKKEKIHVVLQMLSNKYALQYFKKMNKDKFFEKSEVLKILSYCDSMQIYNSSITPSSFIATFNKENVKKIINKQIDYFFETESFCSIQYFKKYLKELMNTRTALSKKIFFKFKNINWKEVDILEDEVLLEIKNFISSTSFSLPDEVKKEELFIGKIEEKCSPEYLIAGDATVCCMSFGTKKATNYALEKGFGIFNVYYKNKIVANSVIWIDKKTNSLIIDNIEVSPNYKTQNDFIVEVYKKMYSSLLEKYNLENVYQGLGYNDLILPYSHCKLKTKLKGKYIKEILYTDTKSGVYIVKKGA